MQNTSSLMNEVLKGSQICRTAYSFLNYKVQNNSENIYPQIIAIYYSLRCADRE